MKLWQRLRTPLLILAFANVLFVFSRAIFDSDIGKRKINSFEFPATVPLAQWQQVASQRLPDRIVDEPPYGKVAFPGRRYQYRQNSLLLNIEMRYELNTVGDGRQMIETYEKISFPPDRAQPIIRHKQLGFYAVFVDRERAYLNACINPRGGSTFTASQFDSNRARYDIQFQRLGLWLLGRKELRDNRCLWSHLSIPLNQSAPESAYTTLERAWLSWYRWWSSRFPPI